MKTLELVFEKADGGMKTVSINNPREDVTMAEATEVMNTIIDGNIYEAEVTAISAERYRTVEIEELQ